jgi:hypothetical protein
MKNKNLIDYIADLPPYLGREILSFLILDENIINFIECVPEAYKTNYSKKYQLARNLQNYVLCNNYGFYLSRIYKKNLRHRYYITSKIVVVVCSSCGSSICMNPYCSGSLEDEEYYISKYIGKNLNKALFHFYLENINF